MNEHISETEQILSQPLPGEPVEQEKPAQEEEKPTEEKPAEKEEEQPEQDQDDTQEDEVAEDKPKKKLSGFTRRLNREREARERAEQRAQELEQRLNAQSQPKAPTTGEPEPTAYEHGINDINYIRDMAKWEGKQAYYEAKQADYQATQQQKFQREIATANANFEKSMDEAADKYEDFDDVYRNNVINLEPAVLHALKKSPAAGDIAYRLLKNKKLGTELAQMDVLDGIRKIGQMEAQLNATPKSARSKMPAPIKTVGTGKTKTQREFSNDMTQEDFNDNFAFEDLDKY